MSIALLVHSGDNNRWVWPYWYHYWKKNMRGDGLIKTYFASENVNPGFEGVECIQTGGPYAWGKTLRLALEKVEEDHVWFGHEDYFITEPVLPTLLMSLHDMVVRGNIMILKCCGEWMGYTNPQWPPVPERGWPPSKDDFPLWRYNNDSPYLVSHQASIWNKRFLFESVLLNESPWQHEINGTERMRKHNARIYAWRGPLPVPYTETVTQGHKRPGADKLFEVA